MRFLIRYLFCIRIRKQLILMRSSGIYKNLLIKETHYTSGEFLKNWFCVVVMLLDISIKPNFDLHPKYTSIR